MDKISSFKKSYRNSFLKRIFFTFLCLICVMIVILSSLIYFLIRNDVIKSTVEQNGKFLNQISYSVQNINESIVSSCINIYYSTDTQAILLSNSDIPLIENIIKMNRIRTVIQSNDFIHSVYIYNGNNKNTYSSFSTINFKDTELDKIIESRKKMPKLKPVLRQFYRDGLDDPEYLFSYFMYDYSSNDLASQNVFIVNIRYNWINDNIDFINRLNDEGNSQFFINDNTGNLIGSSFEIIDSFDRSWDSILEEKSNKNTNYFRIKNKSGTKYFVSYSYNAQTDWTIFRIQEYNEMFSQIWRIGILIITLSIILFSISIYISFSFAKLIYKPFNELIRNIGLISNSKKSEDLQINDEIEFILEAYRKENLTKKKYEIELRTNKFLIKNNFLINLFIESEFAENNILHEFEAKELIIRPDFPLFIAMLKIDEYENIKNGLILEPELKRFIVYKIFHEIFEEKYKVEIVDFKDSYFAVMLNYENFDIKDIRELIVEAKSILLNEFLVSISCVYNSSKVNLNELHANYLKLKDSLNYTFVYGAGLLKSCDSIIKMIEPLDFEKIMKFEKKICEEIKSGKIDYIENSFLEYIVLFSKYEYSIQKMLLIYSYNFILRTIENINEMSLTPIPLKDIFIEDKILTSRTIDEYYSTLINGIKKFLSNAKSISNKKSDYVVKFIKDYIDINYNDSNLTLQALSDLTKNSKTHLGRLFKADQGIAITEYINNIRLEKSLYWLSETDISVNDIALKVGIDNPNYFYKIFKKKYGVTPKQFGIKQ